MELFDGLVDGVMCTVDCLGEWNTVYDRVRPFHYFRQDK